MFEGIKKAARKVLGRAQKSGGPWVPPEEPRLDLSKIPAPWVPPELPPKQSYRDPIGWHLSRT